MQLIDKENAATQMEISVPWLNGMIERGQLTAYPDPNGFILVDADEIFARHYVADTLAVPSMRHIASMFHKITGRGLAL